MTATATSSLTAEGASRNSLTQLDSSSTNTQFSVYLPSPSHKPLAFPCPSCFGPYEARWCFWHPHQPAGAMPDLTGTHLGRYYPPSHPSRLRNEVTAESSDNERSEVQVPDSQSIVPETQYDLQLEDASNDFEPDGECISEQNSERLNTADEAFLSLRRPHKKDFVPLDPTFGAKLLEKPKQKETPFFSPFSKPNLIGKSTQQAPLQPSPQDTSTTSPKPSPPALHSTASQVVGRAPTSRKCLKDYYIHHTKYFARTQ